MIYWSCLLGIIIAQEINVLEACASRSRLLSRVMVGSDKAASLYYDTAKKFSTQTEDLPRRYRQTCRGHSLCPRPQ